VRLTFEQRGTETIDVGGRRMEGRRLALVGPNGAREVWVDGKGRQRQDKTHVERVLWEV